MKIAMEDMRIMFSDTKDRRHWLFDGATAILYISMAILDQEPTPDDNDKARAELQPPNQITPRAAFDGQPLDNVENDK